MFKINAIALYSAILIAIIDHSNSSEQCDEKPHISGCTDVYLDRMLTILPNFSSDALDFKIKACSETYLDRWRKNILKILYICIF